MLTLEGIAVIEKGTQNGMTIDYDAKHPESFLYRLPRFIAF